VELALTEQGKRASVNGARLRAAEQLRAEFATLVFTPDRLAVVKGAPAARRAYFDRVLARLLPSRAPLPAEYAGALAQRNASLRRVAAGFSTRSALAPWTERVAALGTELVAARQETVELLRPAFAERAGELGLDDATVRYDGEPTTEAELEARVERDLDRGVTGAGPHLHDVALSAEGRDLRTFGSQGEQRLTVLSLLLAEAELITARRGYPPLLLLDDVLSELDPERRRLLAERIRDRGQAFVTATAPDALPLEPSQLLRVSPGVVEPA
jgi:DNA replication and repair protein RecF